MNETLDGLVDGFFRHWRSKDDRDFPGWERVDEIVDRDPERAWPLMLALVERAPGDDALWCVAAGPLETFLVKHGSDWLEEICEAAKSPRFRIALAGVWQRERMAPTVRQQVERLEAKVSGREWVDPEVRKEIQGLKDKNHSS
jgi:AcrR family transcriptional regulator